MAYLTKKDWEIINHALAYYEAEDHRTDGGSRQHSDDAVANTREKVHDKLRLEE